MSLSLAGYYTDYKNQQLTLVQVTATSATQNIFTVKKDTIQGIEIEAQARPITGLDIGFGVGAQDAKIKEFGNALSGSGFDPSAYVGNYVPLQSKYTLNASAQYTHAVTDSLDGFVRMDLSRKGTLYWDPDNRVSRPPFNVVNAKVGVRHDPWEVNFYGQQHFQCPVRHLVLRQQVRWGTRGIRLRRLGRRSTLWHRGNVSLLRHSEILHETPKSTEAGEWKLLGEEHREHYRSERLGRGHDAPFAGAASGRDPGPAAEHHRRSGQVCADHRGHAE